MVNKVVESTQRIEELGGLEHIREVYAALINKIVMEGQKIVFPENTTQRDIDIMMFLLDAGVANMAKLTNTTN